MCAAMQKEESQRRMEERARLQAEAVAQERAAERQRKKEAKDKLQEQEQERAAAAAAAATERAARLAAEKAAEAARLEAEQAVQREEDLRAKYAAEKAAATALAQQRAEDEAAAAVLRQKHEEEQAAAIATLKKQKEEEAAQHKQQQERSAQLQAAKDAAEAATTYYKAEQKAQATATRQARAAAAVRVAEMANIQAAVEIQERRNMSATQGKADGVGTQPVDTLLFSEPDVSAPVSASEVRAGAGRRWRALRKAQLRRGFEMTSKAGPVMLPGEEAVALETRRNERGVLRVRFKRGWSSEKASDGKYVLELLPETSADDSGGDDFDEVCLDTAAAAHSTVPEPQAAPPRAQLAVEAVEPGTPPPLPSPRTRAARLAAAPPPDHTSTPTSLPPLPTSTVAQVYVASLLLHHSATNTATSWLLATLM